MAESNLTAMQIDYKHVSTEKAKVNLCSRNLLIYIYVCITFSNNYKNTEEYTIDEVAFKAIDVKYNSISTIVVDN